MDAKLIYLATPYSKFPTGIESAFQAASRLTGKLLEEGHLVYSPIAHTHPIAIYGDINPYDHEVWLPFDRIMMDRSDELWVAMLPSWDSSYGVAHEIVVFQRAGKPVRYLNPHSLELTDAPKAV